MTANTGDKVECMGMVVEIGKILYQDFWPPYGWDIEFLDTRGWYHHWKQWDDGGRLIQNKGGRHA